ncbi:MAG: restriction endonuclease subunit S [Thermoflavifilum sp.]|uniref:restriction endonuclease subunit S n=1 Tax=Thermoflavifilum sp. TaxID=1968839 RepID=UPI0018A3CB1E|nr:restriction endonuclease subunit S [Thermoflavifilum sp.]QOR76332.1 MAG: restriction endonuclease subunit S [Thermoflavifilum sp.]
MKRGFPEHWVETTLKEVVVSKKGKKPKILKDKPFPKSSPYIDIEAFETGLIKQYADNESSNICVPTDVLVVWDGARFGLAGFGQSGSIGSTLACLTPIIVEPRYLYKFIQSHYSTIQQKPKGMATPHVDPDLFWNLELPLPPLNEQKRIAEKLDTILPKVKSARARLEKIPAILKKFRQSVLAAACSGKLTEDWREEYTERTGKELPEWEEKKLNEIIYNIKYGYTSKSFSHGEIKYLRITDIQNGKVSWETVPFCQIEKNVIKKYLLEKNDIVFARTGATTGKSFLIKDCPPSVFASYLIRIKPNTNIVSAEYLYFFFQTEYYWLQINENVAGIAQPNCNAQKLSNILIPLPPLEEQHEIVRRVEKLFALADSIEEKYKKAHERVEKLEQAILARAFRGELVKPDPNDEPAEELLKRILEEKAKLEREQKGKKRKK